MSACFFMCVTKMYAFFLVGNLPNPVPFLLIYYFFGTKLPIYADLLLNSMLKHKQMYYAHRIPC